MISQTKRPTLTDFTAYFSSICWRIFCSWKADKHFLFAILWFHQQNGFELKFFLLDRSKVCFLPLRSCEDLLCFSSFFFYGSKSFLERELQSDLRSILLDETSSRILFLVERWDDFQGLQDSVLDSGFDDHWTPFSEESAAFQFELNVAFDLYLVVVVGAASSKIELALFFAYSKFVQIEEELLSFRFGP